MRQPIISAFVALCFANAVHAQSMFRGGESHAGVYASQGPREFHRVKWTFPTGARVMSSPVSDGSAIYFGSDDGNVYAVDAKTGKQLWQHPTGGPVSGSASVVDGTLYIVSYDGKLYALDSRTGSTKWKFATSRRASFRSERSARHAAEKPDHRRSVRHRIFPVRSSRRASCISAAATTISTPSMPHRANLRWKFATGDVVHASPAYADGVVYFGSWDSYFYARRRGTGKEKWRLHTGEDAVMHNQVGFQSSPAVVNGVVYTGCRDSNLYAIDATSGKEKWHVSTGAVG